MKEVHIRQCWRSIDLVCGSSCIAMACRNAADWSAQFVEHRTTVREVAGQNFNRKLIAEEKVLPLQ